MEHPARSDTSGLLIFDKGVKAVEVSTRARGQSPRGAVGRRTATGVQALAHPLPSFLSSSVKWAPYHLPAASRGCGEMSEKGDVSPGASGEGGRSWDQLELELGEASPCGSELGFTPRARDALEGLSKRVTCSGCRPEEVHSGAGLGLTRGAELQVGESAWWGGGSPDSEGHKGRVGPRGCAWKALSVLGERTLTPYEGLGAGS